MKKCLYKIVAPVLALSVIIGTGYAKTPASAKVNITNKTCTVVEGGTKLLAGSDRICEKYSVTVSDTDKVKAKKNKKDYGSILNPYNAYRYSGVIITGKKQGKTKVVLKSKKRKYIYTVTVLSAETVRQSAQDALADAVTAAQGKADSKWVNADLNGDGIDDLFDNGVLFAYDYEKGKTVKCKTGLDASKIGSIDVSAKTKMMYVTAASGSALSVIGSGDDEYSGEVVGAFFAFDEEKVFKINHNFGIVRNEVPKDFVGKKGFDKYYYCINDSSYDQDDLWYEYYNDKQLDKKIASALPDAMRILDEEGIA